MSVAPQSDRDHGTLRRKLAFISGEELLVLLRYA